MDFNVFLMLGSMLIPQEKLFSRCFPREEGLDAPTLPTCVSQSRSSSPADIKKFSPTGKIYFLVMHSRDIFPM